MTKKKVTQLSYEIIGLAIKVHKELGAGLLESIYEDCLKYELEKNGYDVKQQLRYMAAFFRQVKIGVLTLTLEKKQ